MSHKSYSISEQALKLVSFGTCGFTNMKLLTIALTIPLLGKGVLALNAAEWRSQSIYFLMTDRFSRTDGSTTAPCDVGQRV
jgi:hypothetical protein